MRKELLISAACVFLFTGCANNAATASNEATTEAVQETAEAATEEGFKVAGKWQLYKVYGIKSDGDMDELDPESNQSLYSVADGYFELNEDGTGVHVMIDGSDEAEVPLTWVQDDGAVTVKEGETGSETETVFSFEGGTLLEYMDAPADSGYERYESVYQLIK